MNKKLPLLPVVGKEEYKLFEKLVVGKDEHQLFEELVLTVPQGPLNFEQMAIEWCKKVDAVNIFPKLLVYLCTHYSKWQRNQRVRDAVAKAAPGEAWLREINAGFRKQSASTTEATLVPVLLPPTMPQPQGTLVQPLVGVIVGGTMVGGAPPTRGDDRNKRMQGKDRVGGFRCRHCKYCVQHGRNLEEASNYPGRGGWSMCTGGGGGVSLECVMCNSSIKCRCPMPNATMGG
jgi:hypothetical protein